MRLSVPYILVIILFIHTTKGQVTVKKNDILSRKKRFLSFPKNSNFVCTASSLKEVLLKNPHGYRTAYEADALYPLPTDIAKKGKIPMHYKQRREIHRGVKHLFDLTGFNGDSCIRRLICDIKQQAPFRYSLLLRKILTTVFIDPSKMDGDRDGCQDPEFIDCSFSILNLVLSNFIGEIYH